jgi:hypothetical protein
VEGGAGCGVSSRLLVEWAGQHGGRELQCPGLRYRLGGTTPSCRRFVAHWGGVSGERVCLATSAGGSESQPDKELVVGGLKDIDDVYAPLSAARSASD